MPTRRDLANVIRALSTDAVQKANSGRPGAPMGMADMAEVSWREVLKFNPGNPLRPDRGRTAAGPRPARILERPGAAPAGGRVGRRARERWRREGLEGRIVGIDHLGASAPAKELFRQQGFTVEHVLQAVHGLIYRNLGLSDLGSSDLGSSDLA